MPEYAPTVNQYIVEYWSDDCILIYTQSLEIVMMGCCQSLWGGRVLDPKKKDMMFLNMCPLHNRPFTFACVFLLGGMGPSTPSSQSFFSNFVKAQTPFTFRHCRYIYWVSYCTSFLHLYIHTFEFINEQVNCLLARGTLNASSCESCFWNINAFPWKCGSCALTKVGGGQVLNSCFLQLAHFPRILNM